MLYSDDIIRKNNYIMNIYMKQNIAGDLSIISLSSFSRMYLVPWELPSVLPIIIERPNKDNSVQVSS